MSLAGVTVADSISKLAVSGMTIRDLNEVDQEVHPVDCPLVMPAPSWLTGLEIERDSFGVAAQAKKTAHYNLTYRLFQAEVGDGREIKDHLTNLATSAQAFIDAVIANDAVAGCVDITPVGVPMYNVVTDPSEKKYHGADITFRVMEFIN